MANNHSNLTSLFTDIADAIRSKTGGSDPIIADQFPESIEGIESGGGSDDGWVIGDGNTHIWIDLPEGRTSPMLGLGVNGTVTVDWGDGTAPDALTGTSVSSVVFTPNHQYARAGDYIITLTVVGKAELSGQSDCSRFLCNNMSAYSAANTVYRHSIKKIEVGENVGLGNYGLSNCIGLEHISFPFGLSSLGLYSMHECRRLEEVVFPNGPTELPIFTLRNCYSLRKVTLPEGLTTIKQQSIQSCWMLTEVNMPNSVAVIEKEVFAGCILLENVRLPDQLTTLEMYAFQNCQRLTKLIFPASLTTIGSQAFNGCCSIKYFDFSKHTAIPTLENVNAFSGMSSDYEIRVPSTLADEWKAATNWSTYADYIVGV